MKYLRLFKKCVERNPNKIAVAAYGKKITYKQLDSMSSAVASFLLKNTKKEQVVIAICSDGSIDNFIALLGCIKAGKTFINIDTKAPLSYVNSLYSQLQVKICLYSGKYEKYSLNIPCRIKISDIHEERKFEETFENALVSYYVATSGTTGKPKIVYKTEEALLKSYLQMKEKVQIIFETSVQQYASLAFAFGLDQTLIMLIGGTSIFIDEKKEYVDLKNMYHVMERNNTEVVFWSASIVKLLSRQTECFKGMPSCLKHIVVGGEPLVVSAGFVFELRNRKVELWNNYGSTETGTIFFSRMQIPLLDIKEFNSVSIGKPLPGMSTLILNKKGEEIRKGDLYILTEKFYNSYFEKDLNKEKFLVSNKYPGKELCKMGDIAECKGGDYYILGRKNNCVNIRGYRVEIEHVERVIMQILGGEECCIFPVENQYKEIHLICYFIHSSFQSEELLKKLKKILPEYMLPTALIKTNEIAHSKNGKIERNEMKKKYEKYISDKEEISKEESLESRLKSLVEKMLQVKLSEDSYKINFRDLGLDSLALTDYICTVENQENIAIEDQALSEQVFYNISSLAQYIRSKK